MSGIKNLLKEIGLQPGENMHEIIKQDGTNSSQSEKFTVQEIMEVI